MRPGPVQNRSADIRSLRTIVDRTKRRGVLVEDDFAETITQATSTEFDEWVQGVASRVTGESDVNVLNEFLYDAELLSRERAASEQDEPHE